MGAQLPGTDDGKNEEDSRYDEVDRDLFIDHQWVSEFVTQY